MVGRGLSRAWRTGARARRLDAYAQRETSRWLEHALADLPAPKREVFVLYELKDTNALGVPEKTALYRLYGARKALASSLRRRELRGNIARTP